MITERGRILGVAAVLAALFMIGCSRPQPRAEKREAAIPVTVMRMAAGDARQVLTVPARVKAREEVTLTAAGSARLTSLPFAEGARFAAGVPLARFDAPESRDALSASTAARDAAETRLTNALRQEARMDSLYAGRVVALRDAEVARAEARSAEAARAGARATLEQQRAASSIVAPFAGVVVRHRADVGTRLTPGAPVLDVRSLGQVEIEVPLPESAVESTRGARVSVKIGDGVWHTARLLRLDGMIDPATRTRTAYFALEVAAPEAEPGAFAHARFETTDSGAAGPAVGATPGGRAPALLVPTVALVRRGALTGVYVIREGRASLRWVKLGHIDGGSAQVLAGLWAGEDVALDPAPLSDGRPVEIVR